METLAIIEKAEELTVLAETPTVMGDFIKKHLITEANKIGLGDLAPNGALSGLLENPATVVEIAKSGLSISLFSAFAQSIGWQEKKVAEKISLNLRTLKNYTKSSKLLTKTPGEQLLKLVSLFHLGERVFGTLDEFNEWLNIPFWNRDTAPIVWLDTPAGIDFVMNELNSIKYGYSL